jgi:hypothetical protein
LHFQVHATLSNLITLKLRSVNASALVLKWFEHVWCLAKTNINPNPYTLSIYIMHTGEPTVASDYKTEAEVAGFKKKTKKPKKRIRAKSAEPEGDGEWL